jgi:hypothetical protein
LGEPLGYNLRGYNLLWYNLRVAMTNRNDSSNDNDNANANANIVGANTAAGAAAAASTSAVQPGQMLGTDAMALLLARCAPQSEPGGASGGGANSSLYLTAEALAALPNFAMPNSALTDSGDAQLREWRQFLSRAEAAPGGDALLKSDTGLVALRSGDRGLAIIPPFPLTAELAGPGLLSGWDAAPLTQLLTQDYTVGVLLLRLGRYLVAVFEGERLLVSKTNTRYVKGKHHAGGTSQLRFQRIREGQMRKLYDETCRIVQDRFAPHIRQMDYILLGGDRLTLSGFMKVCPYLQQRRGKIIDRRLNIRDPKHDTLETVAGMLRQCRVWPIGW